MRIITILTAVLFMTTMSFAQLPTNADGKVEYSDVVSMEGSTAAELYQHAKNWAPTEGLKEKKMADGEFKGVFTGSFPVSFPSVKIGGTDKGTVTYTVAIFCKDGRYKYKITNFYESSDLRTGGDLSNKVPECGKAYILMASWAKIKRDTKAHIDALILSMKAGMKGHTGGDLDDDDDDW